MAIFLVTGGAGFIGSFLVEALVARGQTVRVIDDLSCGSLANLRQVIERIEFFQASVDDSEALMRAMQGVECVFHFAAPVIGSNDDSEPAASAWVQPTDALSVLNAARKAGARRVVYASSGGVYANPNAPVLKETDPILPLSRYAFTKLTGEHQCMGFSSLLWLETVRLRYFNVFGPRQSHSSGGPAAAFGEIVRAMMAGQRPVIRDNASQYHDFLYVDDAVHAAILAAEEARSSGKVYNIARGRSANLLEVVATANEILGRKLESVCGPSTGYEFAAQTVSITKAEVELGFCPKVDLQQGLTAIIDYYRKQSELVREDSPAGTEKEGPHFLGKKASPGVSTKADHPE
jgi:UDP-glucose 4-epimerase